MPQISFPVATLVQTVDADLVLGTGLFFPEMSCLAGTSSGLRTALARRLYRVLRQEPPGALHRRRFMASLDVRKVTVEVPPLRGNVARRGSVSLAFPYVQWAHGQDAVIAFLPSLDIEVLAASDAQLQELLVPQIRAALARRDASASLKDLVHLARFGGLRVKTLPLSLRVPTLKQAAQRAHAAQQPQQRSVLKQVAVRLGGRLHEAVYEREGELRQLAEYLTGRSPVSVLLVGPSGAGKSALVRELARRRSQYGLGDTTIYETSGSRLIAGMCGFGMWQDRCQRLVRELARQRAVIHLGSLMELMEVGKSEGNPVGFAAMLRPALAGGEVLAVAECTPEQFAVLEREDPQLAEAFTCLDIPATGPAATRQILSRVARAIAPGGIEEPALDQLDFLHRRYATYSAAPGRPLRFLKNLLADRPLNQSLDASDVTAAFSRETGLPLLMLDDEHRFHLDATRQWFGERVMGQPEPVEAVTDLLAAVKSGLSRVGKPIASFLFIGPTGVGKTEMAKALAEFLYHDPGRMIRFDMSEFRSSMAVDRLIGGWGSGPGLLTQKVRDQPFMVVLLDEFEKAHSALYDILLQVLGEGRLTDGAGRVADFTNSVMIMTSNLGADGFRRTGLGFAGAGGQRGAARDYFDREVRAFLRPEMYNRIDRIIPFLPLAEETMVAIVRRELDRLIRRDGLRSREVRLEIGTDVASFLARQGGDPRYGARPLQRAIERRLIAPLAQRLCQYGAETSLTCQVAVVGDELRVEVMAAATRPLPRSTADAQHLSHEELHAISHLRRQVQKFERSALLLRLRNEIDRLKQVHEHRARMAARRGKPLRFSFTPEQARLLQCEALLGQIASLSREVRELEDRAVGAHYRGTPIDRATILEGRRQGEQALHEHLFALYVSQQGTKGRLSLAVFAAELDSVVELVRSYESIALRHETDVQRYWLLWPESGHDQLEPALAFRLTNRQQHSGEARQEVLDVLHRGAAEFYEGNAEVVGLALQLSGDRAAALLETEAGRHEFRHGAAKPVSCYVETVRDRLVRYAPPADVGRATAFRDLAVRRTYDRDQEICQDPQLDRTIRTRGQTLAETLELAMTDNLTRRMWSLLD